MRRLSFCLFFVCTASIRADDAAKFEPSVAIEDVCAWPNVQLLPNGDILAVIFNQPVHGSWEGDVDCWASSDGGKTWQKRGTVAAHEPGTNRMNHTVGIAKNGDVVAIVSGYPKRPKVGVLPPKGAIFPLPLPNWVCRSSDQGKTWTHTDDFPLPKDVPYLIPFGDIVRSKDGTLTAAFYGAAKADPDAAAGKKRFKAEQFFLATSRDDGKSWNDVRQVHPQKVPGKGPLIHHEPAMLALDDMRWLCAMRGATSEAPRAVLLYGSDDAGATWTYRSQLSEPSQFPSHLLRLADGRILLTFGSRTKSHYGVGYRLSKDEGKTWSDTKVMVHEAKAKDGGYPSSVQLKDGTVVTAYYMGVDQGQGNRPKYHMGVVRWRP